VLEWGSKRIEEIAAVPRGTVKWFNTTKGYGFTKPDDGGGEVLVHISAVEKAGRLVEIGLKAK
jgi:cold shock CspA family protein